MIFESQNCDFLNTLTPQDVKVMLHGIRDRKERPISQSNRTPVYGAEWKNKKLALKLTRDYVAESHAMNTELFRFFKMPFVPCQVVALENNAGLQKISNTEDHIPAYLTHVVVMPLAQQENFEVVLKNATADKKSVDKLYQNILSYGTEICLTHCWDCKPKNIQVKADKEKRILQKEKYNLHPDAYVFIDAEFGLLNKEYRTPDELDIDACLDMLRKEYLQKISPVKPFFTENIRAQMLYKCDFWRNEIKENFTMTIPEHRPQLQQMLLNRTDSLQDRLMTIGLI